MRRLNNAEVLESNDRVEYKVCVCMRVCVCVYINI